MIPAEVIQLVSQFGSWVVFLYLYFAERKRSTEIQEARIQELKDINQLLTRMIGERERPPIYPPSAIPKQ